MPVNIGKPMTCVIFFGSSSYKRRLWKYSGHWDPVLQSSSPLNKRQQLALAGEVNCSPRVTPRPRPGHMDSSPVTSEPTEALPASPWKLLGRLCCFSSRGKKDSCSCDQ